jgi:hypothetical protein
MAGFELIIEVKGGKRNRDRSESHPVCLPHTAHDSVIEISNLPFLNVPQSRATSTRPQRPDNLFSIEDELFQDRSQIGDKVIQRLAFAGQVFNEFFFG